MALAFRFGLPFGGLRCNEKKYNPDRGAIQNRLVRRCFHVASLVSIADVRGRRKSGGGDVAGELREGRRKATGKPPESDRRSPESRRKATGGLEGDAGGHGRLARVGIPPRFRRRQGEREGIDG